MMAAALARAHQLAHDPVALAWLNVCLNLLGLTMTCITITYVRRTHRLQKAMAAALPLAAITRIDGRLVQWSGSGADQFGHAEIRPRRAARKPTGP